MARGSALAQVVLLFLVAVLTGRLMLEPSGLGFVVLSIAAPLLFLLMAALQGWRVALGLMVAFLALAGLARILFASTRSGWLLLVLLPMVAATVAIVVSVARKLLWPRAQSGGDEGGREEGGLEKVEDGPGADYLLDK